MTAADTKQHGSVKLMIMQFAAGGCAGFVEVSIMHPLDLIKTRFQIQGGPEDPHRYTSIVDCFRRMYKSEGPLSFYKGILPPLLAETPKRAVKFFTFERYKTLFAYGDYLAQPLVLTAAGLFAGMTEALVINPFEVVKVRLQAERSAFKKQPSTFHLAREIVAKDGFGLKGLNKGLTSTLGRHGVFNMVYFSFYHNIKAIVPEVKDPRYDLPRRFVIGLGAGVLASCINIPWDVAKSRIQGPQPVPGQIKYRTCFQTMKLVYREEGYFALYKGLLPKVLRLGPGGAIMLLVYEMAFDWMKMNL
ncbi:mitochondrial 2-oxodicarboxylate carrier-like isoform X2 [Gigantopelta aegis]|uniref:mitochondrial 2-oxodicarboxylate carrier-like isoform X2 n=1 Tax=Gigantopelta aegis TaxID=1735272 RepID=UPI001B88E439|nr:mitochondrial 2-oxodicarboxylate carrier-like isoform X2 [Gigantopelta aegis]